MGDAVNLASRLEDASERGEILVGPDTHRLTALLFEFEVLEPIRVKGKAEPVALGSGGGNRYNEDQCGGTGGGAVHLVVDDTLRVDGQVSADGSDGAAGQRGCGGGSGGSLWIEAGTITGTGTIRADGGDGSDTGPWS